MQLRRYMQSDCKEVVELFYNTVHIVNKKDYSKEQLDVWATGQIDFVAWNLSLLENYSIIAIENGVILGFGDIDKTGYLNRLFVHANHQNKGIATALCDKLEQHHNGSITTHSSITAKPFFEKRGYKVLEKQRVEREGLYLINFLMIKVK